jgi:hypothetical protein
MTEDTYTYTARSSSDPSKLVTFTIKGDELAITPGLPLEQVENALSKDDATNELQAEEIRSWLKPLAISVAERLTQPIKLADVHADLEGDWLQVRAWLRPQGLRLAPIGLMEAPIDNPDAAQSFVAELHKRKETALRPGKFQGPMDYWISWAAAGIIIIGLLWHSLHRLRKSKTATA